MCQEKELKSDGISEICKVNGSSSGPVAITVESSDEEIELSLQNKHANIQGTLLEINKPQVTRSASNIFIRL